MSLFHSLGVFMIGKASLIIKKLCFVLLPERFLSKLKSKYRGKRFVRDVRSAWLARADSTADNHVQVYWESKDQPNRKALIDITKKVLEGVGNNSLSILEFGSHVGVNIYLLNEVLKDKEVIFFAVEPNKDATEFLKEKMPFVNVLQSEDEGFIKSEFPFQKVDVCLINAVFYCVSQKRTYKILKKLSSICNCIIIGDELDNLDGEKTIQLNAEPYSLLHPYRKWLREMGFEKFELVNAPVAKTAQNAFLIARKL